MKTSEQKRGYDRVYYQKNKVKLIQYQKEYKKRNKDKYSQWNKEYNVRLRFKIISYYSNNKNECRNCGINDIDVLCVDHINNDGNKFRKINRNTHTGNNLLLWILKNNFPDIFQILCSNCNLKKEIIRRRKEGRNAL